MVQVLICTLSICFDVNLFFDLMALEKKIGSGKYGSLYMGTARIAVNSAPPKETTVAIRKCIVTASTERVFLIEDVKNLIHIGFHENIMCLLGLVTMDPTTSKFLFGFC